MSSPAPLRHAVVFATLISLSWSMPAGLAFPAINDGLPDLTLMMPSGPPPPAAQPSTVSSSTVSSSTVSSSTVSSSTLMVSFTAALPSAAQSSLSSSAPSGIPLIGPGGAAQTGGSRCGNVSAYFGQTPTAWQAAQTDGWLDRWWHDNENSFKNKPGGFAAVFGEQYLGNPDWSCSMDGSTSNCDYNPCRDSNLLEQAGPSVESAYYVIESINRFHAYFTGLSQALQVSGIFNALNTGSWVQTFWNSPKRGDAALMKISAVVVISIVAIAAAFLGPAAPLGSAAVAATASLFAGAYGIGNSLSPTGSTPNDRAIAAAEVGRELADTFLQGMKLVLSGNDLLMSGQTFGGKGDMRSFVRNGSFVNFSGVNQTLAIDWMNTMLLSKAINNLWRTQKVFILGGGPCDDSGGVGKGPQNAKLCRDGKAWYLYFWKEHNGIALNAHRWGWVDPPPGAIQLGYGDYRGISVQDIISSSLDSYAYGGFNYTDQMAHDRSHDALEQGWANPGALGPAWEGIFNIPVCDVSGATKLEKHENILMDYGSGSRPHWCGNICSNDEMTTKAFIHAANMDHFGSLTAYC